jgi:hypothetical protein
VQKNAQKPPSKICSVSRALVSKIMETELEFLAVKYSAGILNTKEIIEYVNAQLDKSIWSDVFLEILDSDPLADSGHISVLFEKYLIEKLECIPTLEQAVKALVNYHVCLIASNKVDPYEEFGKLLLALENYDYHSKTEHYVGDSLGISTMYGWYYDDYNNPKKVKEGIHKESKLWLSEYAKKH